MTVESTGLPAELEQLELALFRRPLPGPSDGFRERVVSSVNVQLRQASRESGWGWVAALAAGVVLWMNLSMSATLATDFGLEGRSRGPSIEELAEEIRTVFPEISEEEAVLHAISVRAAADLVPHPVPVGETY